MTPSLSPYLSPLQDLEVNIDSLHKPIEFAVPKSRLTRLSKIEVIRNVLETLSTKKAKLAPLDFLQDVLD